MNEYERLAGALSELVGLGLVTMAMVVPLVILLGMACRLGSRK